MQFNFDEVVTHLRKVKTEHGDESFHTSLKVLFRGLLGKPGSEEYIKRLCEEFGAGPIDLEGLKAEAKTRVEAAPNAIPTPSPDVVRQAIEQEMPNCKTQAHFDLVIQAWTALKVYLDAAYGFEREKADQARAGLNRLMDLAPQLASAHAKIQENPEATTNRDYVEPARELTELHKQQLLITELQGIDSRQRLDIWYTGVKEIRDSIVSQKLRDEFYDLVRAKKHALAH